MNDIIDQLTPADFGKSFDMQIFEKGKQKLKEQSKVGFIVIILQIVGLIVLILLGGFIGLGLFFAILITAMIIALSKRNAVKQYQNKLKITNAELKQALDLHRKR